MLKIIWLILIFILIAGCIPKIDPEPIPWQNLSDITEPDPPKYCDIDVRISPAVMCSNYQKKYFWVHGYTQKSSTTHSYYGLDVNASWKEKWDYFKDDYDNVSLTYTCQYNWCNKCGKDYKSFSYVVSVDQFEDIMFNSSQVPPLTKKTYYHMCAEWN